MNALQIAEEISNLTEHVLRLSGGKGYKAPYMISAEGRFLLGNNDVQKLLFNVPADGDFFAERLNLYLQYRFLDVTSVAASDLAFRPCNWTSVGDVYDFATANTSNAGTGEANAKVSLRDDTNGKYQSAPFSVAGLYSSRFGLTNGVFAAENSMYRGGLDFEIPMRIGRGKAAELEVTPQFSSTGAVVRQYLTDNPTFRIEFRVVGLLRGYRNIRAFK
jgi:hypothetical protein